MDGLEREQVRREALRLKMTRRPLGWSGRVVRTFLSSRLTALLVVFSLILGGFAVFLTPREEEPQIKVPMVDVFLTLPGSSALEVSQKWLGPVQKALGEIEGVDEMYATAQPSGGMVIVRFLVGTDPDTAALRVHARLAQMQGSLPPQAAPPLVVPRGIDDVPVLAYTLWSEQAEPGLIRRVADELKAVLSRDERVARVDVIGGGTRRVNVLFDRERLEAHDLTLLELAGALSGLNTAQPLGSFVQAGKSFPVELRNRFRSGRELGNTVVAVRGEHPVYLRDLARIVDGGDEPSAYVWMMSGAGAEALPPKLDAPAITVSLAKKGGVNAVELVKDLDGVVAGLKGKVIPEGIHIRKTRDYGATADEKSSELIFHMGLATLSVVILMAFALGYREALVVAVAVPMTLALTLAASYFLGYSLNRVTLFALIFSIGILVDDAIVVVENIHRHYHLGWGKPRHTTVYAVDEVGNPTILATFAVVAALLPLAMVSGLMGPYMRPIPINASAAMLFSLLVAFVVSPWLTHKLFRKEAEARLEAGGHDPQAETPEEGRLHKLYARMMLPLISNGRRRWFLLGGVGGALLLSLLLLPLKWVTVKMLPHDNKNEVQIILDMPPDTPLEETARVVREMAATVRSLPEVSDLQVHAGTAGPFNFNGLVRHYFLRAGARVADIQVNLLPRHERSGQSHATARAMRDLLGQKASQWPGARIKVTEVPPGPPVLSTLVAEVYGPDHEARMRVAADVLKVFRETPGVVDSDWMVEDPSTRWEVTVDRDRAAQHHLDVSWVGKTLGMALSGHQLGRLAEEHSREGVPIVLRLDRGDRSGMDRLLGLRVRDGKGQTVPLSELVRVEQKPSEQPLMFKNQQPVTYVTGEMSGSREAPIYGMLDMQARMDALLGPDGRPLQILSGAQPRDPERYALKWDGEWQITLEVFRDMGLAFMGVMLLIYFLVVGWFRSLVTPLIIMVPIPLTLVGILPAHALGGVFFTATSMIGFIALAGIIVRNSILLVDFINLELQGGTSLDEAVLKAGAVRFRPIALTAAALVAGGAVILMDPIFQGLAVALISGVLVATALTLVVIPLLYHAYVRRLGVDRFLAMDAGDSD